MVIFRTLEKIVDEVRMKQENDKMQGMIKDIQHTPDCTNPQITVQYLPDNSKNSAYKKTKVIAGCLCGAKVSMESTGNSSTKPSYSSQDQEAVSYY